MSNQINMKTNDLLPLVEGEAINDETGLVEALTGAVSAEFHMRHTRTGDLKVNSAATIVSASLGQLRYTWLSGDTDTPGHYQGEFEVLFPSSKPMTVPANGYIDIYIEGDIA